MSEKYDLIIKNGQVMTPGGLFDADIGVTNGKIITIGSLSNDSAEETYDATGLHVIPGVIMRFLWGVIVKMRSIWQNWSDYRAVLG